MTAVSDRAAVLLRPAGPDDRADAAAFVAHLSRWDQSGPVRLRTADPGTVQLWGSTPFDALVTRSVSGELTPSDATVHAGNLLAALAVARDALVDPGPTIDASWRAQLPPAEGWVAVDQIPASVLADLAEQGADQARSHPGPGGGASAALLDSPVLTVSGGNTQVSIPLRVLFALSGMGFAPRDDEPVRLAATASWIRLDARYGAVVRRRRSLLPLLV